MSKMMLKSTRIGKDLRPRINCHSENLGCMKNLSVRIDRPSQIFFAKPNESISARNHPAKTEREDFYAMPQDSAMPDVRF